MRASLPRSLRVRLLLWLLVPLGALAVVNLLLAYREAEHTASRVQDRLLLGSARIIAQQTQYEDGVLEVAIRPAALELFHSGDQDRVYYRIASARGVLLSGYAELPPPPSTVRPEESLFFSTQVRDQPVRVVAYAQPLFGAPGEGPVVIEVAQTYLAHRRMVQEIWTTSLRQESWMLALAALIVGLALRWGLQDLVRLQRKVQERTPGSLEPLDPGPVAQELQPLVEAINGYVKRLDDQMAVRSRFIANSAHQLRTPFTVLQTQVNFGLRSREPAHKDEALRAIFQEVRHGTRLVNQMLSLSAAEARAHHTQTVLDLGALVQRVLEEQAALAQARNIDLGLDLLTDRTEVQGSGSMLHELVSNLVDNALRYTPAGGVVTLRLLSAGADLLLQVEDNGPGIPPADRARVFERFCRLEKDDATGSGLGLAIVQEIASVHGAQVRLATPEGGQGLVVTVAFPARRDGG